MTKGSLKLRHLYRYMRKTRALFDKRKHNISEIPVKVTESELTLRHAEQTAQVHASSENKETVITQAIWYDLVKVLVVLPTVT